MSQQKQAPLPRQEFQEWLENAAVPVLVLQKGKHLGSVVKVPATPEIDYLFGCETFYGERISWSDRLEFCGLYDRQHQALHLLDDPLPNFVSGLTEEECQDSTAFGKRIAQEVDRYVEAAISNERSRLSVRELTSERNINSYRYYKGTEAGREAASLVFSGEKPDVQFHSEYRIGKLYAAGLGCEQDYGDAARWFQLSADKGYKYAQYSLAGLFRRGQGVEQDDARALELYTASAQQDFPYAAYELGKMYRDGIGCEKDAEASEQWYRQAFAGFLELEQQSHDDKLQYRIGWMLLHGVGTGKDETAAREWFEQASKLDNPHAQYQLARMIFNDPSSTPEQTAQALERLTKAAEAGQDCAQYALGKIYRDGQGVEKDIQKAVALFTLAATKENSFAAFALGKLYLAGDAALPRDPAAALKWLTYAAELGNQFAQYRLGKLLLKGDDGIPKDVITAIRWLTAAAKQENGYAEYALALVYLTGEDAPKDSVKALSLLKRSAGRGNQFAQYRLGKLLLQGEDAPKDVKAAIRWLTAAAEQGNQYAQYALGKLYLLGKEVPKDRSSAIKWFQLAADQGNEYAQYFLKHMDDRLGQPPVAAVISLFHHLANIFQEQNQPPPSGGVRVAVDRKLLRKIKAKKIAQGHKADDHEPEMQL